MIYIISEGIFYKYKDKLNGYVMWRPVEDNMIAVMQVVPSHHIHNLIYNLHTTY